MYTCLLLWNKSTKNHRCLHHYIIEIRRNKDSHSFLTFHKSEACIKERNLIKDGAHYMLGGMKP